MAENLQEYVDSGGIELSVDREAGVIQGVKLIGLTSRNGRRYHDAALREAVTLYEGAKVNVNHPNGGPLSPRDYRDRLGVVRRVRHEPGSGLFGDLHYNPKHALAEQLAWDAEHNPQNVGFSHNVTARVVREDGADVVQKINHVHSVDLVADPATTKGLFEQNGDAPEGPSCWDALTFEQLMLHRPDLVKQYESDRMQEAESRADQAIAKLKLIERGELIRTLLERHGLPASPSEPLLPASFVESLMKADEDQVERLIEQRAGLIREAAAWHRRRSMGGAHPVSRDQAAVLAGVVHHEEDPGEFARAIKAGAA